MSPGSDDRTEDAQTVGQVSTGAAANPSRTDGERAGDSAIRAVPGTEGDEDVDVHAAAEADDTTDVEAVAKA